jgi:uncharacterized protein (DUF427 family)
MRAIWNDVVVAESDDTVIVDGNHYFPSESLKTDYFVASEHHTTCGWKGVASYYSLSVAGKMNSDAAWFYPEPKDAARHVRGRVAFWRGVQIVA